MKKLLLIIDYQFDFVAEDGKLTAGAPAQKIESALAARAKKYLDNKEDVLCTLDTHPAAQWQKHPEEKSFPIHCEENTPGWELYGELSRMQLDTIIKTSYMMDFGDIDWIVRQYDCIELSGVTTDICVLQNAIGLYNHAANIGKTLKLYCNADCVASFDAAGHEYAIKYMNQKLGISLEVEEII